MPYLSREKRLEHGRKYWKENKEVLNAKQRVWHMAHREQDNARRKQDWLDKREYYLRQSKEYRKTHKAELNEYAREYRERNRVKINERIRAYSKTAKGKERNFRRAMNRRRLLLAIKSNAGTHSKKEWDKLCDDYSNKCAICGEVKKLTRDHIKPLVLGGSDRIENIQPLCVSCNARKGKKYVEEN